MPDARTANWNHVSACARSRPVAARVPSGDGLRTQSACLHSVHAVHVGRPVYRTRAHAGQTLAHAIDTRARRRLHSLSAVHVH